MAATSLAFTQENDTAKNKAPRKSSFVDKNNNGVCDKKEDGSRKGKEKWDEGLSAAQAAGLASLFLQ